MTKHLTTRNDFLKLMPALTTFAELGVYTGVFSEDIIKIAQPKKLYLVDLWEGGASRCGDKDGLNMVYHETFEEIYNIVLSKFASNPNVEIRKQLTTEFLKSIPNNHLDAVYIDATHDYINVKAELELCRIKVKKSGVIMGHDYAIRTSGVMKAVNEFVSEHGLKIDYLSNDLIPSFFITNL